MYETLVDSVKLVATRNTHHLVFDGGFAENLRLVFVVLVEVDSRVHVGVFSVGKNVV